LNLSELPEYFRVIYAVFRTNCWHLKLFTHTQDAQKKKMR